MWRMLVLVSAEYLTLGSSAEDQAHSSWCGLRFSCWDSLFCFCTRDAQGESWQTSSRVWRTILSKRIKLSFFFNIHLKQLRIKHVVFADEEMNLLLIKEWFLGLVTRLSLEKMLLNSSLGWNRSTETFLQWVLVRSYFRTVK